MAVSEETYGKICEALMTLKTKRALAETDCEEKTRLLKIIDDLETLEGIIAEQHAPPEYGPVVCVI